MKKISYYYSQSRPEIASLISADIKSILDVGCGEGDFLEIIKEKTGAETWGIEVVAQIADKAKQKVDNIVIGKIEESLSSIPDAFFDCITFNDVLEHLIEPNEIIKLVKPKLTPNGKIIASIPNIREFYTLYNLIIKKDWEYKDYGILDSTHIRFFTKKSIVRMFEQAGYKIIKIEGINANKTWKFKLFNFITFYFFNDSKFLQFVCIAKK